MDICTHKMDIHSLNTHKIGLLLCNLVFLIAGVTRTKQQDNFYFDPAPINQDVPEGDSIRLRCDVSNDRHIAFNWELNDKPLANTSRRFQEKSDLRILRVNQEQDGGSFRCIATNMTTGVSIRSTEARLNILWMSTSAEVELNQPRTIAEVVEGVDLMLRCQAEGNLEPSIEWFKNKIRLFPSDRKRFHKNNRVKITGITAGDNGVYSCLAKNNAGQIESADNFYLNIKAEGAPHLCLDTFTRVLLVKEGGRAQFNCQYNNSLLTEWYFSEKRLTNSSAPNSRIMVYSNGSLVLSEVRRRDAGTYTCVGLSAGEVQSFVTELLLAYIDTMSPSSFEPQELSHMPHVIPENNKFNVRCLTPKGLPLPSQRWEGPFGDIPDQGRIKAEASVLSISNAHPDDSGNYTCVGANLAGERRQNIWIVVSVPPRITTPPLSERVIEQETAMFVCKVQGTPYPVTKISWRKEDGPLDLSHPRFTVNPESGTLTITNARLNDVGNYACMVNTTGHPMVTSQNARLYAEKQLKFTPIPVNTKLELSSESRIYCKADGRVTPNIRWAKIGQRGFPDHVADIEGTLHFEGVLGSDAGRYMCIAKSEQGQINTTIEVEVVVKPSFLVHPSNTTGIEGSPVINHCIAEGVPQPKIIWDKNNKNKNMDERRFTTLSNGSLLITEVYMEDIGHYGCTAGNVGGFLREEIYLTVKSGTPTILTHQYSKD